MKSFTPSLLQPELLNVPVMTVARFADLIGLKVGVCEAQANRKLWPLIHIGKRRFINIEQVRKRALCESSED